MALVNQTPWIRNATVRENILFGHGWDPARYLDAIQLSCLGPDIEILAQGDQTVIGEKGINLSGGQKTRLSLARAIYADREILVLDDPLR